MSVHLEGWKGTHGDIKRLCVVAFYESVCVCVCWELATHEDKCKVIQGIS